MLNQKTSDEYTAEAAAHDKAASDSFDRCDTDGFVSQFSSSLSGRLAREKARLAAAGGMDEFPALFDLQGRRVRAKLITGQFGMCWSFCDANGRFTGKFIKAFPKRANTMEKKGYREQKEMAPADAKLDAPAGARGFSGLSSVFIRVYRTDSGYPADAVVA